MLVTAQPDAGIRLPEEALEQYRAEKAAATIRCYSGSNTPELLSTEDFARLVRETRPRHDQLIALVGNLLPHRQDNLWRRPPPWAFFVVSEEAVKRLAACPRERHEATAQLQYLFEVASRTHISLRIYDFAAPVLPPSMPFTVTTDVDCERTAFVGDVLAPAGLRVGRDGDVLESCLDFFAELTDYSLSEDDSRAMLGRALLHRRNIAGTRSLSDAPRPAC
ncbi:Scr1 family TA system antitoxin-like transcriptional regulator [Amycolatopsis saalfeldensis]|uniref:DUF5753 domain-containing protein n=1 Tax=Amycolatopsis saalfeldensis TaxID=394193 RepID=A0A1H8YQW5_9PSEU|nr:Scr1 family TA system antitoxin-like transcriptional regulator [Amycolatopsis saalfeldensis]SEP53748.1 hypothetical protein SAMN04489732_13050 [Amycolatopsis saalfeldensis]